MFSTLSPLFLVPLPYKLAVDFQLRLDVHTTQVTRRTNEPLSRKVESTRNGFASVTSTAIRQQRPHACRGAITQAAPRITQARASGKRRSPYAGRGVSPGQIFVTLAMGLWEGFSECLPVCSFILEPII